MLILFFKINCNNSLKFVIQLGIKGDLFIYFSNLQKPI